MRKGYKIILLSLIFGALSGVLASLVMINYYVPDEGHLIKEWYKAEVAVSVSPHGLRKHMAKGDDTFVIVDLRSDEEYNEEHIVTAINIPAYKDPDTSAYGDVERIVSSFAKLKAENPGKDIIVYCYSIPCMTGRKIGKMLSEFDIYVQHLGVGWNEWRYDWESWNHHHEWETTDVMDYIATGSEPGAIEGVTKSTACPIDNEFGC
jgi:hypothetical protein|tara:strand:- start:339 stop:956 length:618 start_codon:yes stop_codon:yes gene_type:complete